MAAHFATTQPYNNAPEVTNRLVTCNKCGDDKLCWYQSRRTGNWYLADVQKDGRQVTREAPNAWRYWALAKCPHRCPARQD
jgi:hypothetical protein